MRKTTTIIFKSVGTDASNIHLIPKRKSPPAPYSMLDHIEHLVFACHGACIENTTLIGVGGGGGVELFMVFH